MNTTGVSNTVSNTVSKFYDENTEFIDDIILNVDEVTFIDINVADNEDKEKIPSIIVTKLVQNEFIQYSEQDFKSNLVILLRDSNNNIKLIENLYKVFYNINNTNITDDFVYNDDNLNPIIFINKKFYTNENDNDDKKDAIIKNENNNIIKLNLTDYITQKQNITDDSYNVIQNQLYNLDKPFEDDNNNINLLDLQNYVPTKDRDALSSCIFDDQTTETYNEDDSQCVNINNVVTKLETFRIISPKSLKYDKNELVLYNGDNVKIVGYVNRIPKIDDEYKIFNIDKYFEDVNELEKGDEVDIYFNIKLDEQKVLGKINSIKDNKITIKLSSKIKIDNISTKVLLYDKSIEDNDFYIYPRDENEIYHKNLLKENIIAFRFSKDYFEKASKYVLPNLYQLMTHYDDITNYINIKKILTDNHYSIDNLNENDINLINSKFEEKVTEIESIPIEKLQKKKLSNKKLKVSKLNLVNLTKLPKNYSEYPDYIEDTEENRYKYLTSNKDIGYIHFLKVNKEHLEESFEDIKDNDFKDQIDKLKKEKVLLEEELEKLDDDDECKQIKIEKIYYNISQFEEDEGNDKYNNKYVILVDNEVSTLYIMNRGNWTKITNVDDKNEIKICDGKYYYQKIKENKCTYDDVSKLCKKRDFIKTRKKLDITNKQIEITKEIKDFQTNYKEHIKNIDELIEKYENINNKEFKSKQISYKKQKIQNKYTGNADYVDFSQQFENIDMNNLETFNPLDNTTTTEVTNPFKDEKNFILIEKILNNIGIELTLNEKMYIYESTDFLSSESFSKKIQSLKKNNPKIPVTKLISEYSFEKKRMNLLTILGLITIIVQIQFPNVEIKQIYNRYSDIFTIDGFPKTKDEGDKQLYKYILSVISDSDDFVYKYDSKDTKFRLKDIALKNTIDFILKKKDFLKNTLENKVVVKEEVNEKIDRIWSGFKPELDIKDKPTNLISKYLYDINDIIKKGKIYNFNIFRKPLKLNICCLETISSDINYYNLVKNKIDYSDYQSKFNKNLGNNVIINEIFINIIKKTQQSNFDNLNIFPKENLIKFSNIQLQQKEEIKIDYFDYSDKLIGILNNQSNIQIKNDTYLKELFEDITKDNNWFRFSTEINKIFDRIIEFTSNNSELLTDEIKDDLYRYFITLEDLDNLHSLKRISFKFINTKISSIINKIKNYKQITIVKNKYLKPIEISEIMNIKSKDSVNQFIENIQDLDIFKGFNFDIILDNINCFVSDINLPDNNKSKPNIDNLTKNIYILNYIFLTIILYIYSSLVNKKPKVFDNKSILDEVTNTTDGDKINIIADIIAFILTEYRNNVSKNIINNEKMKSKMDKYREDRKNMKLNKFKDLDVDEADTLKLLKDVVGIEYDYEEEKTSKEITTTDTPADVDTQEVGNQEEENMNYTSYRDEYKGENDDELIEDN